MSTSDTLYSTRGGRYEQIEQGRTNVLTCPLYRDGALVAVTSGTVTVYDATGTALVAAAAVTVPGGVPTYSLLAATVASSVRGTGWRVEWALTIGGVVTTIRKSASLVLRAFYPSWTEADLYRLQSSLDPARTNVVIHGEADFSDKIDTALAEMERWLVRKGNRPNLIIDSNDCYDWGVLLTLALIYEDFTSTLNPAYAEMAKTYRERANAARDAMTFVYDTGDTGQAEDAAQGKRRSPGRSVWLGSPDRSGS